GHKSLAAKYAFRTYFPCNPCYFRAEYIKGINHLVQVIFQLEELALHIYRNLLAQVAPRYRDSHIRYVPYLARKVTTHCIYIICKLFPDSCNVWHIGLAAQFTFSTYFTCHTGYLVCKYIQRNHHLVQVILQLEEFSLYVYRYFLRQVTFCNRSCHTGNIADLAGKVSGHDIHILCKLFPYTGHIWYRCLTTQFPL